jgi:hypothetical protein
MSYEANLNLLKIAIVQLGELSQELIFVGGVTTSLYINEEISEGVRPTEDVDCVIEVLNKSDYREFEKSLIKKGFKNDTSKGAPLCRFTYGDILILDVMPDDEKILGFSNEWYKDGIKNKITVTLDEHQISIFTLPYFIASKIKAFEQRGSKDPRLSWDLEDIVLVLEGLHDDHLPENIKDKKLKVFLEKFFNSLLTKQELIEAKNSFLNNNLQRINFFDEQIRVFFC